MSQLFLFILSCHVSVGYSQTIKSVFSYKGADTTYTVPLGVTTIVVKAWGAGGGGANSVYYTVQSGGAGGGYATATLTVVPGQVLTVRVGQGGITASSATIYGGGGAGYYNVPSSGGQSSGGGSGGGYSGVFSGTTALIIAGGGGGGAAGADNGSPTAGGGGGTIGNASTYAAAGHGGTQTAGGAAGTSNNTGGTAPTAGSSLHGGNGGVLSTTSAGESGGGGGGGFFGGGGGFYQPSGSAAANGNAPGGGGSSYTINLAIAASTTAGSNGGFNNLGGSAANTGDVDYVAGIGNGVGNGVPNSAAGNGRVVISYLTILPLDLTEFKAVRQNTSAVVSWTTATEVNTSHFIVEKSADGKNGWQNIKVVPAFESANHSYTMVDNSLIKGANFYRLTMFDKDGRNKISSVVLLNYSSAANAITVFPNPVKTTLSISGLEEGTQADLLDVSGVLLQRIVAGTNGVEMLPLNGLPHGTYLLSIKAKDGQLVTKKIYVVK